MPLVAAAVCPSTPLLVPEVAAAASHELDDLRAACDAAVAELWSARPELVAIVGVGAGTGELSPPYRGSFAPWGVPVSAGPVDASTRSWKEGEDEHRLALGPLVGLWLLARHKPAAPAREPAREPAVPVRVWTVAADAGPADCAELGRRITVDRRVALLVIGDGAACHGVDPRAEPFDVAVLEALVDVDTARLLALDPELAARLLATGRAPWQVLAGAAGGMVGAVAGTAWAVAGTAWAVTGGAAGRAFTRRGHVWYAAKPYNIGYFVASWS